MNSNSTLLSFLFILFIYSLAFTQEESKDPSFEEVLSLRSAGSPVISPDGKNVVFPIRSTDWKTNGYDNELWLSKDGQSAFQLTNTSDGSSFNPQWTPDGKWITFLAKRGKKTQLQVKPGINRGNLAQIVVLPVPGAIRKMGRDVF